MRMVSEKRPGSLWEPITGGGKLVDGAIRLAQRDLKTAEAMLREKDYDWAFAVAYNAMLQAGRALMFSDGVRPKGEFKHVAVVQFVRQKSPGFAERLLDSFDRSRRRRHTVVYEQADTVSAEEAERAAAVAEEFVERAEAILKQRSEKDTK